MKNLIIFDTTLRDGEQSPGASMTKEEKVRIAKSLDQMNVDIIEAGFAVASVGDFEAVQAVANAVKNSTVCSLARALDKDIDRAAQALKGADSSRIHTFIATSEIHMQKKLNMHPDAVLKQAIHAVKRARNLCDNVEFSPEDAGRSDLDFLCRIIEATIDAGATTINIPDTVGYNLPQQFGQRMADIMQRVPNAHKAIFSTHCHNDLGLAVANSLAAVQQGARQVECTINGLGERAGNAALEEIVMAVKTRQDIFDCDTRIDTTKILATSRLVSNITGFVVQPNKAIVGANAFAHESGIHQDGVLKHRETYEIMRAEDVGWHANQLILGKHSGRNAIRTRLSDLNIEFESEADFLDIFVKFKALADQKHQIFDEDLQLLASQSQSEVEVISLLNLSTHIENGKAKSEVSLVVDGVEKTAIASSSGGVDATFLAINKMIDFLVRLDLYSVNNVTAGTDALAVVNVRIEYDNTMISASGSDVDIIQASAKAYILAINKAMTQGHKSHPQL